MVGVVETIIGVCVGLVNHVLTDRVTAFIREYVPTGDARAALETLGETLTKVQNAIDAMCDDGWLFQVALICYDAEDLLDKIHLRWMKKKKKKDFKLSKKTVGLIKDVNYQLAEMLAKQQTTASTSSQPRPPELGGKCEFREEIKKAIVEELVGDGCPRVTLILGVKGAGKTALADAIIEDARVTSKFNCIKIPMASATDFVKAEDEVKKSLKAPQPSVPRTLLILLDGLENVQSAEWASFKRFLEEQGSMEKKVLVTSRNPRVAVVTRSVTHHLDEMGSDDCYELIKMYADPDKNLKFDDRNALETFKVRLGTKCYGLPLLAYRLGLLLSEQEVGCLSEKLRDIDSKDIPGLLKSEKSLSDLLPGFLPFEPNIQRCLAYCSLFPPVHDFGKASMTELWISEGFVQDSKRGLEKSAIACFDEIIAHSIYHQPNQQGAGGSYKMHKLFHDLAKQVAGKISHGLVAGTKDFTSELKDINFFSDKRHLSLSGARMSPRDPVDIFEDLNKHIENATRLRTFLLIQEAGKRIKTTPTVFKSLIYLRVLDLSHSNLTKLDISKLEQLRFLDLSFTPVSDLGKLAKVFALRTLKLKDCKRLFQLPNDISELTNLVRIEVKGAGLASMPPFIGKLINLQTLDDFVVGIKEGYKLVELASLNSLRESLCIKKLENVKSETEAAQAKLSDKKHLRTLRMEWSNSEGDEAKRKSTSKVLEALQPPTSLATLRITNYCGDEFPSWLGEREVCDALETLELRGCNGCTNNPPKLWQLGMLKILRIHNCSSLTTLPSLEQLVSLQVLEIKGCNNMKQMPILPTSIEREGVLIPSQLESLVLSGLDKLAEWTLTPNSILLLRTLQVRNCSMLRTLPSLEHLTMLQRLEIDGCTSMKKLPLLPPSLGSQGGTLIITGCEMNEDIPTRSIAASTSPASDERSTNQDNTDGSRVEEEEEESPSADFQRKRNASKSNGVAPESESSLNAGVAYTSQVGECVPPESEGPLDAGVTSNSQRQPQDNSNLAANRAQGTRMKSKCLKGY